MDRFDIPLEPVGRMQLNQISQYLPFRHDSHAQQDGVLPTPTDGDLLPRVSRSHPDQAQQPQTQINTTPAYSGPLPLGEEHLVSRIGVPYARGHLTCPYLCGRTFKHASQRILHVRRSHTFEKPFHCSEEGCDKAFYSSAGTHPSRIPVKFQSNSEFGSVDRCSQLAIGELSFIV